MGIGLLERVELWAGLDLEDVHLFTQLRNLKYLSWHVPMGRYVQGVEENEGDLNI